MKRIAAIILIAIAITAAFLGGWSCGIRHAIENSEIWTVDVYDPDDPEGCFDGEYQLIYIELDEQIYVHEMIQC